MKVRIPRFRRNRRSVAVLAALIAGAIIVPLAAPGGAVDLPMNASTFNGSDGNEVVDGTETDWVSFTTPTLSPNLFRTNDTDSGSGDNSLAGGTKDDTECATASTGSIPQNKDDLLRFYLAHETITSGGVTNTFLYLAYARALPGTTTASAHGVFELNTANTKCPDIPGKGQNPDTPSPFYVRTHGDVRIAFDDEGGDTPIISVQRWQEPCPGNNQNDPSGCWSAKTPLNTDQAVGEFNSGTIDDPLFSSTATLPAQAFAEMKINMNAAGLIAAGSCIGFGAAGLFTGASGNSDQEQSKDFIAPTPINLNFCAPVRVRVNKSFGATPTTNAVFTMYYDTNGDGVLSTTEDDTALRTCTITPADISSGSALCTFSPDLAFGTAPFTTAGPHKVIVRETTVPNGFTSPTTDQVVTFTFGPSLQTFTVNFSNNPAPGDVFFKKVDDSGTPQPLPGAVFTLYNDTNGNGSYDAGTDTSTSRTCTTDAGGDCREGGVAGKPAFENLALGKYCVVETTTPTGYDTASPVCFEIVLGSTSSGQQLDLGSITNPRKHRIIILVCHEGTNTLTASNVTLNAADPKTSIGPGSRTAAEQAALCNLGGASYGGLSGHTARGPFSVTPGHP